MGARDRCAWATICTICASTVADPDALRTHHQRAAGVECRPDDLVADALGHGNRLAGEHGLIHRTDALGDRSIHGNLLPGTNAQRVAHVHIDQWHIFLDTIGADASGRFRRKSKQRPDRSGRLGAGLEFQDLAQERQRNDDGSGFEIDRHAPHGYERRRKHLWRDCRHHAEHECRPGAQANQRPHVGTAIHDGLPAAHEERPARPQHDWQRDDQLHPALRAHLHPVQAVTKHRQHEHDKGQWQRPPEPSLEVAQLGVIVIQARELRLQRHAALRAVPGMVLADLRMHRTGVDRPRRRWRRHLAACRGCNELGGVFRETRLAPRAAKVIHAAGVLVFVCRLLRDSHAAYGVFHGE